MSELITKEEIKSFKDERGYYGTCTPEYHEDIDEAFERANQRHEEAMKEMALLAWTTRDESIKTKGEWPDRGLNSHYEISSQEFEEWYNQRQKR